MVIAETLISWLPIAIALALSPLPVAAVIMLLLTARAASNAPAFLLGWMLGILSVGGVVFVLPGLDTARGEPTALSGVVRIVLGAGLIVLTLYQWRKRRVAGASSEVPGVLARMNSMGTFQSWFTGYLFASLIPNNFLLSAAGAAAIDASMLNAQQQFIALLLFTLIASLAVALPVAVYFLARRKIRAMFERWKDWLIRNMTTINLIVLPVLGILLLGRGIEILAA